MRIWKKILIYLLCILLLPSKIAYADGSGNIDGGGGDLNHGKNGYTWPDIGYDGVRVSLCDAQNGQKTGASIDYTNLEVCSLSHTICHFGKVSKMEYRGGAALSPQVGAYHYQKPPVQMPQIISGNSQKASMEEIRAYFCSEAAAIMVANDTGVPLKDIEMGKYKLVIEPLIYLIYQHLFFVMTTTEAGIYNQLTDGNLGYHFPTVVMKNLALAMYLERDDLGFSAWHGSTDSARTTDEMISILGIGIVSYQGAPPTEITWNRQYRTDTEVIVAVTLTAKIQKTPDNPAYAKFMMNGSTYTHKDIYIPKNGSQLAWVKWRTPKNPGKITIKVTSNCDLSANVIIANIVALNEHTPPDPKAKDRKNDYTIPAKPNKQDNTSLTWGIWNCWWHENWVWHGADNGYWCNHGWWDYGWKSYTASLLATLNTTPDKKNPTYSGKTMKSGYGFNMKVTTQLRSSAPKSHLTGAQNAIAYFPEFYYKKYWRLLKRNGSTFNFKKNPYSTYNRPVHFIPVWYPNGKYVTYTEVLDAWTPAGMLQINLSDRLTIHGSLYDDWHIRPVQ